MLKTISKIFAFVVCFTVFHGNYGACEINKPKPFYVRFFESSFDGFVADTIAKIEKFQKAKGVSSNEIEQTQKELRDFFSKLSVREKYDQLKQAHLKRRNAIEALILLEAKDRVLISELREKRAGTYVNELKASFLKYSIPSFTEYTANIHTAIDDDLEMSSVEKKQAHREADEFFKEANIKEWYEKLEQNCGKLLKVQEKINELEKQDPSLKKKFSQKSSLQGTAADKAIIAMEYSEINIEQESSDRETLMALSSIREEVEIFEKDRRLFAKWNKCALADLCYAAMSGFIANAAILGLSDVNTIIASILWIIPQPMAAIIENGPEELVKCAASHGKTEDEAVKFGLTTAWFMETMIQQDPLQQQNS
jgi:hypothetical protein